MKAVAINLVLAPSLARKLCDELTASLNLHDAAAVCGGASASSVTVEFTGSADDLSLSTTGMVASPALSDVEAEALAWSLEQEERIRQVRDSIRSAGRAGTNAWLRDAVDRLQPKPPGLWTRLSRALRAAP